MRRGEVLGLTWKCIDFGAARLSVTQTLVAPDYEVIVADVKPATARLGQRTRSSSAAGDRPLEDPLEVRLPKQPKPNPGKPKPPAVQGVSVVAGAGFEPATFGL